MLNSYISKPLWFITFKIWKKGGKSEKNDEELSRRGFFYNTNILVLVLNGQCSSVCLCVSYDKVCKECVCKSIWSRYVRVIGQGISLYISITK